MLCRRPPASLACIEFDWPGCAILASAAGRDDGQLVPCLTRPQRKPYRFVEVHPVAAVRVT